MVGEGLHGLQQLGHSGAEQADRHGLCLVPSGQVEDARCGHQVHVQGAGVALHGTEHQLEDTGAPCHNQIQCVLQSVTVWIGNRLKQLFVSLQASHTLKQSSCGRVICEAPVESVSLPPPSDH